MTDTQCGYSTPTTDEDVRFCVLPKNHPEEHEDYLHDTRGPWMDSDETDRFFRRAERRKQLALYDDW